MTPDATLGGPGGPSDKTGQKYTSRMEFYFFGLMTWRGVEGPKFEVIFIIYMIYYYII